MAPLSSLIDMNHDYIIWLRVAGDLMRKGQTAGCFMRQELKSKSRMHFLLELNEYAVL